MAYRCHRAGGWGALAGAVPDARAARGPLSGPASRARGRRAPLGCDVPPWRDIDALRIDTSQLQKQEEGSDTYLLAVTLRNQGRATTASAG
ncbi:DUF3426 domain-containing protein [Cupriavidus basilensis]